MNKGTQTPRTEIAAIVARLRRHARRASIEKGYVLVSGYWARLTTRNELAQHLREVAKHAEDTPQLSRLGWLRVKTLLTSLDEANPCKRSRAKRS